MKSKFSVCYQCTDRRLHCHNDCEKYLDEKRQHQQMKQQSKQVYGRVSREAILWNHNALNGRSHKK